MNWKFSNLGACELKISKFGGLWAENFPIWGLWAKILVKIEAVEAKFPNFLKRGSCELTLCLKWDPCELQERREKGVSRAAHPHTLFLGQCPPSRKPFSLDCDNVEWTLSVWTPIGQNLWSDYKERANWWYHHSHQKLPNTNSIQTTIHNQVNRGPVKNWNILSEYFISTDVLHSDIHFLNWVNSKVTYLEIHQKRFVT